MRSIRLVATVVTLTLVGLLAACSGSSSDGDSKAPKPLTQEQAELLATVRFRNYDAGVRKVVITIPDTTAEGAGSGGRVEGWVDFVAHLGYASVAQGNTPLGAVAWNAEKIALNDAVTGPATLPVPESGWRSDRLDPQTSSMTRTLAIVLNLASDRPENPLLLRQSDAAFIRNDKVDGTKVVVLAGPSQATSAASQSKDHIRYWINDDGLLLRVQVKLPGTSGWTSIDFADAGGTTLDATQLGRALK